MCAAFFFTLLSVSAQAHKFSTAYMDVREHEGQLALVWKVSLHDLAQASIITTTDLHQVSWQQVLDSELRLLDYLRKRLNVISVGKDSVDEDSADEKCQLQSHAADWLTQRVHKELFLVLPITVTCNFNEQFQLRYQALFDVKHSHKLMLSWHTSKVKANAVLAADANTFPIN
jgi:hypothetical protein